MQAGPTRWESCFSRCCFRRECEGVRMARSRVVCRMFWGRSQTQSEARRSSSALYGDGLGTLGDSTGRIRELGLESPGHVPTQPRSRPSWPG